MNTLQRVYNPAPGTPIPAQSGSSKVGPLDMRSHSYDVFNPVVSHRYAGFYPTFDPIKRTTLVLEETPPTIFQHAPSFAFYPEHSNLDVDIAGYGY